MCGEEREWNNDNDNDNNNEDDDDDDGYSDEDFEDHNDLDANKFELGTAFRESQSFGDAYEEELNMECERLRAELEQKMLAKFEL